MANLKNNKEGFIRRAGDAVERAGEKIADAGAEKVGSKIYNAGDKLEHSQDDKIKRDQFPKSKP